MKIFTDEILLEPYKSRIFDTYFGGKSFAVFDIETTGLFPASSKVILCGILMIKDGKYQVIQYFANHADDEKKIIEKTAESLANVDYIITYNGKHFDIPFIQLRAQKHRITFPTPYNLDLYLILNGYSHLREFMPNLKQKSVEIFMGLATGREDEITGKESVQLYDRYMQTQSLELERKILLHNHDDVIQLYRLLPVIAKTDFHTAMNKQGFPAGRFNLENIVMKGHDLHVLATQVRESIDYISFPTETKPYSLTMDKTSKSTKLIIPCACEGGVMYLDALAILGEDVKKIEKYPSVVNGYLIVNDNGKMNHMEVNGFLKVFFENHRPY